MKNAELCAIEFQTPEDLQSFREFDRGRFDRATVLEAGPRRLMPVMMVDFPTRDILELFDNDGRHRATFIGPDALEHIYQIKLGQPGQPSGFRPEAFR